MSVLLADVGNSSIKLCRHEPAGKDNARIASDAVAQLDNDFSDDAWTNYCESWAADSPATCYLSSVNNAVCERLAARLGDSFPDARLVRVTAEHVPMSVDIETPNTLGIDRVLAAYAAASLPPDAKAPRIVIDAGTAVTIDLVDQEHVFQGGVIFPGLETNLNSLHHATADLPSLADQLEKLSLDSPIGKSTESAILQGVVQAQIGAITNIAQKIADSLPDVPAPIVVASGGGIERLRPSLPDHWTYSPNLVLRGLAMVAASDRS